MQNDIILKEAEDILKPKKGKNLRQKVKLQYPQLIMMSQSQLRHEDSERSGRSSFLFFFVKLRVKRLNVVLQILLILLIRFYDFFL